MIITVSITTLLITLCVNCLMGLRYDVKLNYRKRKKAPGCLHEENEVVIFAMFLGRSSAFFSSQDVSNFVPFLKLIQTHLSQHNLVFRVTRLPCLFLAISPTILTLFY